MSRRNLAAQIREATRIREDSELCARNRTAAVAAAERNRQEDVTNPFYEPPQSLASSNPFEEIELCEQ